MKEAVCLMRQPLSIKSAQKQKAEKTREKIRK